MSQTVIYLGVGVTISGPDAVADRKREVKIMRQRFEIEAIK